MRGPEDDWLEAVLDLARTFRWTRAHFRPALTKHGWRTPVQADGKGWPDLVLVRERVLYAELKAEGKDPTPEQDAWLRLLANAGQEVYVWRPSDAELVLETLRARRPGLAVWEEAPS